MTTVSKEPEQVWDTAGAIYVLTAEDLRRSGVANIADALRLVPGVDAGRNDAAGYSVGVRGFQNIFSKGLLVLLDGRPEYTTLFGGVYWDLINQIPIENIARVEVIRGPGATLWGANAVNGVINIITKSAAETQGLTLSAGGGNFEHGRALARYGGAAGRLSYRVYGNWFSTGPEHHLVPGADYDRWSSFLGGFRADWFGGYRDTFLVQGDAFTQRLGEQVEIAFFNESAPSIVTARDHVAGGNLLFRWKRQINDSSDFQLQTYFDRTDRDRPQLFEKRMNFDLDFIHHFAPALWDDLIWGAGLRVNPDRTESHHPGAVDFFPSRRTDFLYTAFVQNEFKLLPGILTLTTGVKLEHNDFSGFEYQPTARILFRPRPRQSFWASATRAVRTPSQLDQNVSVAAFLSPGPPPVFLRIIGQPDFRAEVAIDYEAGYRQLIRPSLYVDIALFHNAYHGLQNIANPSFVLESAPPPPHNVLVFPLVNGASGPTEGIEITPSWTPLDWLRIKAAYSYAALHLRSTSGPIGNTVALNYSNSAPRNRLVLSPSLNLPKNLEFDASYFYTGATASDSAFPVPAYHSLDARLGWRPAGRLELSLAGQNLLRPFHLESSSKPPVAIRRSVFAKFALNW